MPAWQIDPSDLWPGCFGLSVPCYCLWGGACGTFSPEWAALLRVWSSRAPCPGEPRIGREETAAEEEGRARVFALWLEVFQGTSFWPAVGGGLPLHRLARPSCSFLSPDSFHVGRKQLRPHSGRRCLDDCSQSASPGPGRALKNSPSALPVRHWDKESCGLPPGGPSVQNWIQTLSGLILTLQL